MHKFIYSEYLEPECVNLLNALNSIHGVRTGCTSSGKRRNARFSIWFGCRDHKYLFPLARALSRNYGGSRWECELEVTDRGTAEEGYTVFCLHSGRQQGENAYKEANRIALIISEYLGEEERYSGHYCKKADKEDVKAKQEHFLKDKKRVRLLVENHEEFDGGLR